MLRQWNSRKPWLNPEDPRLGWAPEWNPEHKDICKKQKIIIPTKTSFGNYLPPLKFSCLYLFFFSGWRSADGSAHTASWHIPKHRKHKGSRDLVHHLEIKLSSQACLPRLWLTAAAEHMLGSACKINHKIHTSRTVFLELWEQKDSKQLKHFQNQFSNNNLSSW